jgi:CBS-domain-containing membrane protein
MDSKKSLGAGVVLVIFGGAGMILAPTLGATELARPWSFLAGFLVGIVAGLGVALTVHGLAGRRRAK